MLATFLCIVYPLTVERALVAPAVISVGSILAFELRGVSTDPLMRMALYTIFLFGPLAACVIGGAIRRAERGLMNSLARERELRSKLDEALRELSTVEGIVGICLHCKKLRDRQDKWQPIEKLLSKVGHIRLSHGICPTCLEERYPEQPTPKDGGAPD